MGDVKYWHAVLALPLMADILLTVLVAIAAHLGVQRLHLYAHWSACSADR